MEVTTQLISFFAPIENKKYIKAAVKHARLCEALYLLWKARFK